MSFDRSLFVSSPVFPFSSAVYGRNPFVIHFSASTSVNKSFTCSFGTFIELYVRFHPYFTRCIDYITRGNNARHNLAFQMINNATYFAPDSKPRAFGISIPCIGMCSSAALFGVHQEHLNGLIQLPFTSSTAFGWLALWLIWYNWMQVKWSGSWMHHLFVSLLSNWSPVFCLHIAFRRHNRHFGSTQKHTFRIINQTKCMATEKDQQKWVASNVNADEKMHFYGFLVLFYVFFEASFLSFSQPHTTNGFHFIS